MAASADPIISDPDDDLSETEQKLHTLGASLDRLAARSLGCWVARLFDRSAVRSLDGSVARSLDRLVARSIDRCLARSLARSLAQSLDRPRYTEGYREIRRAKHGGPEGGAAPKILKDTEGSCGGAGRCRATLMIRRCATRYRAAPHNAARYGWCGGGNAVPPSSSLCARNPTRESRVRAVALQSMSPDP